GRTGKLFAIQHFDITPDLLACAKSIAGGVPMGAVLIGQNVKNLTPGVHGSTFGGNPLACAAAIAALQVIVEENLPHQALVKGAYFRDRLLALNVPAIREVRGIGLMIGIEMKQKVAPYIKALQEKKIIALNAGMTVIRLLPPLVITYDQLDQVLDALEEVLLTELVAEVKQISG
ncbi:MAG TPA: aminotransferase class III-fold pyridoxal phosphate-dependent enzyme, partial [Anaerolineales bacterium]|nr:aminotransferase class III-fold pyridoxal phosphate-dependent enzyme [Anaerolineales bacterium]